MSFFYDISSDEVDGERVIQPPTLTMQFMAGKKIKKQYFSMYNLTKENLGPFNHTNIISGYLRVK
jgi:hypothetical protein